MRLKHAICYIALAGLLVFMFSSYSFAEQSTLLQASIVDLPTTGNSHEISCGLHIVNPQPATLVIESPRLESQFGYSVTASPSKFVLRSGMQTYLNIRISIRNDGRFRVNIPLVARSEDGIKIGNISKNAYFVVDRGAYRVSTFRELFVNPLIIDRDDQGQTYKIFRTLPPPDWDDSSEFDIEQPTEEELESMTRSTVYSTDWSGTADERHAALAHHGTKDTYRDQLLRATATESSMATAKGTLKFTGADGLLHPAYYWKVVAYMLFNGYKFEIARTRTSHNGSWTMQVPAVHLPVRIEYQPQNRYFSFADMSDNAWHSFSSGATYTPVPGGTINEFTQALYSATSDLLNLGELYRDGIRLWVALLQKGGGIDPVRSKSIVVYYPNDQFDCGHGTNVPWSCAEVTEGFIWITPEHGEGRAVFPHELGHQIHYEYWQGDIPAPGHHPVMECTNPGVALTEGFADFVVHWSRFGRTQVVSGDWTLPVENPVGACQNASRNQLWVTATFWDMYDSLDDGADYLRFKKEGAPIGIFLANSGGDSMGDYRLLYMNKAGSGSLWVFNTFNQNHQGF